MRLVASEPEHILSTCIKKTVNKNYYLQSYFFTITLLIKYKTFQFQLYSNEIGVYTGTYYPQREKAIQVGVIKITPRRI